MPHAKELRHAPLRHQAILCLCLSQVDHGLYIRFALLAHAQSNPPLTYLGHIHTHLSALIARVVLLPKQIKPTGANLSEDDDFSSEEIITEEMLWERIPEVDGLDRANTYYELSARIYARGQYDEALALAETARDIYSDLGAVAPAEGLAQAYSAIGYNLNQLERIANSDRDGGFVEQVFAHSSRDLFGHDPSLIAGFAWVADGQAPVYAKQENA